MKKAFRSVLLIIIFLSFIGFRRTAESDCFNFQPVSVSHILTNRHFSSEEYSQIDYQFTKLLSRFEIPGASVAIARNGNLVFAKGYGYANKQDSVAVEPKHLFRIASCSKLITAIAILKLTDDKKLTLEDKVFGPKGILNDSVYLNIKDKRVYDITLRHLLQHSGGWRYRKNDPMFNYHCIATTLNKPLPLQTSDIIQYILTKKLDFNPGSRSSYSNIGYAILGEVIRKITGISYESYVKHEILIPLGIYEMYLGKSLLSEREENEVVYYSQDDKNMVPAYFDQTLKTPAQYGGNDLNSLCAAGAWIASPVELLRLILAVDGKPERKDILSENSINELLRNDKGLSPIGWKYIKNDEYVRTGSLTGTFAVIHFDKDLIWIFEMNTSYWRPGEFHRYLHKTMQQVLNMLPANHSDFFSLQM